MTLRSFTIDDRDAVDAVLDLDRRCTPALRDDADLLDVRSAFRPAGQLRGFCDDAATGGAGCVAFLAEGAEVGVVGWVGVEEVDVGVTVVDAACAWLRSRGARRVVGPMNLTTWRRYRCVVDGGADASADPFFLEPRSSPAVAACFVASGFVEAKSYATVRIPHVEVDLLKRAAASAERAGLRFTPLEERSDDALLGLLHTLSLSGFEQKTGFRPASADEFRFLYGGARALLSPGLSWLASDADDNALGFLFAYADPLSVEPRTVLKTLAITPRAPAFLGWALMQRHVVEARARGFSHGLYALMEKAGPLLRYARDPRRMGGELGAVFRRYALFEKQLSPAD